MTKARSNAVAAAAKGDLTVGTGTNLSGILPVSSQNGDTIVADASTATGLRWQGSIAAGKNAIINGAMDIWQRGTSFTNPATSGTVFSADRWLHYFNGNGTVTQETTVKPDTSTYAMKITATASSSDNAAYQLVEQLQMEQFRGKSVTLSIKLAGTATLAPVISVQYSTTANDNLFNTSTGISASVIANPTLNTSTYVTYISQFTIPTTAKTLRIAINSGLMANTNVLYIAEAQLELGLAATAFSRAGGSIQGELAACQRYYFRNTPGTNYGIVTTGGVCFSTTTVLFGAQLPVQMRVYPTSADFGNLQVFDSGNSTYAISAVGLSALNSGPNFAGFEITATGLTAGRPCVLRQNNNAAGFIGFSAEL